MTFLNPNALFLLFIVPVFVLLFIIRTAARVRALDAIGDRELIRSLTQSISPGKRLLKSAFWILGITAVIVALARPTWGYEIVNMERQGAAVVFAVDLSRSMNAEDVAPDRLSRAKLDMIRLVDGAPDTAFGIIIFARDAVTFMPLTFDREAARLFINQLDTRAITSQGTNIATAINAGVQLLSDVNTGLRTIILLTDGENHEGDPIASSTSARDQDIRLHVMGYGSAEGSVIPVRGPDGNTIDFVTDADGTLVESRLGTELLQEIANITGGQYAINGDGVDDIIAELQDLPATTSSSQSLTRPAERSQWFVVLALVCLSASVLITETRAAR